MGVLLYKDSLACLAQCFCRIILLSVLSCGALSRGLARPDAYEWLRSTALLVTSLRGCRAGHMCANGTTGRKFHGVLLKKFANIDLCSHIVREHNSNVYF